MTDFYSQNRCVCSTRSHGPLLCAFCLSFHFNLKIEYKSCDYMYTNIIYRYGIGKTMQHLDLLANVKGKAFAKANVSEYV